jgi:hypothetical protein
MVFKLQLARMSVNVERRNVVLTISPPRAHHIAMVIDRAQPRQEWLRDTVRLLLAAAERLGVRPELVPPLSRSQFLPDARPEPVPVASKEEVAAADGTQPPTSQTVTSLQDVEQEQTPPRPARATVEPSAEAMQQVVAGAAEHVAAAASTARAERASAVAATAEAVADRVARTAAAVQSQADAAALSVARAAGDAAALVAARVVPGGERTAARTAARVVTEVAAAAIRTAEATAAARADVARKAAAAALAAALAAADAATIVELEVANAAEAIRAVAAKAHHTLIGRDTTSSPADSETTDCTSARRD